MIDLHIHTNASADGQYGPADIVAMAKQLGLSAIAFADHNVVGSLIEGRALCAQAGIDFVEAVELNTDYGTTDLHILGFGVDPQNAAFTAWLDSLGKARLERAKARADKLVGLGLTLTYEEVAALTPGRLPTASSFLRAIEAHPENRAHPLVAPYIEGGAKVDNAYVNFYFDVMANGPAFADVRILATYDAIEKLREFGALPILAHPNNIEIEVLDDLIDRGLAGIEAASSYHDQAKTDHFLAFAKKRNLLVTAGSDFHGPKFKKLVKLGKVCPNDRSIFDALMLALGR